MLKKFKKLFSLSMMLLLLLQVIILPGGKIEPDPDDSENGNPPVTVHAPGLGDDDETRN